MKALELRWEPLDVACPICDEPAGKVCRLGQDRPYGPLHSARRRYARKLTEGPIEEDLLYVFPNKFRLRGGTWRLRNRELAIKPGITIDFDAIAGMWRVKEGGPRFLSSNQGVLL